MAKQARVRPSWKKFNSRAIKRGEELLRRLYLKRINSIVARNGIGSMASLEGQAKYINPNEPQLRLI